MIYNLNKDNYSNFKVISVNRLKPRAYFVPFANQKEAYATDYLEAREKSGRVKLLNGVWDFKFYKNCGELPAVFDSAKENFDKIEVPSCWQLKGYEPPFYVNARYIFSLKPPHIPTDKSVGSYFDGMNRKRMYIDDIYNTCVVYKKTFDAEEIDKAFILAFYGVSSNIELYVNGQFVGYSESSHNTSEFDITKFVKKGGNEILAVVRKWCNGSYLECQDMFRHSGIFRDVALFVNNPSYIYDFELKSKALNEKGGYEADLKVNIKNFKDYKLSARLLLNKEIKYESVSELKEEDLKLNFKNNFIEYNAEIPTLYDLELSLLDKNGNVTECIVKKVGFRRIEIKDGVYYLNGKAVKLKGVNHHDTDPEKGYYLTPADMLRDVRIFKEYNINTVRTSHYPPDPLFIEICDREGVYVVAEADIETHGTNYGFFYTPNKISNNKKWRFHYLDRVERMYLSLRNNPSVIMWSLGNEAGGISNQDFCNEYLKKVTGIPVHYEGAIRTKRLGYDVFSMMYPDLDTLKKVKDSYNGRNTGEKPVFICEYGHSMGTGPGNLKEYMEIFESGDRYLGGCIWEFCDHAIAHKEGKYKLTYGGDHGEFVHDGNFCTDGLFNAYRQPFMGAMNLKHVYRPYCSELKDGSLTITNKNYFKDTKDILIKCVILSEGKKVSEFTVKDIIQPQQSITVSVDLSGIQGDTFLNIVYSDKAKGNAIAEEQLLITEKMPEFKIIKGNSVNIEEKADSYIISFDNGSLVLNKADGNITSYKYKGAELLKNDADCLNFTTNIKRAETDNSRIKRRKRKIDEISFGILSVKAVKTDEKSIEINIERSIKINGKESFKAYENIKINADGSMEINNKLNNSAVLKKAPECYGIIFKVPQKFENVEFYGRGPSDSYPDSKEHMSVGIYRLKADDFMLKHVKPQESGNRCDTRYAKVTDSEGSGFLIQAVSKPFNLNIKPYSADAINQAMHFEDLKESDGFFIQLDSETSGVGSASCGPDTLDKYKAAFKEIYEYSFKVLPLK